MKTCLEYRPKQSRDLSLLNSETKEAQYRGFRKCWFYCEMVWKCDADVRSDWRPPDHSPSLHDWSLHTDPYIFYVHGDARSIAGTTHLSVLLTNAAWKIFRPSERYGWINKENIHFILTLLRVFRSSDRQLTKSLVVAANRKSQIWHLRKWSVG